MITTICTDEKTQILLEKIYDVYMNYVKKNYLCNVGDVIESKMFIEKVKEVINLAEKDKNNL